MTKIRSIKSELERLGIRPSEPDPPPREEFVTGEIAHSRTMEVNNSTKTLYGKPIARRPHKYRHGRAVIMDIQAEMGKGRRSRESNVFKVAELFINHRHGSGWWSANVVASTLGKNTDSIGVVLGDYHRTGLFERKGEVDTKGYVYRLSPTVPEGWTAEELYLRHLNSKQAKKPITKKKVPTAQPIIDALTKGLEEVLGVKVEVSGNINITFRFEQG